MKNTYEDIILKDVRVVFSHLNTPQKFDDKPTSVPRYSVSILVEKNDKNFKAFVAGAKKALEGQPASKVKSLLMGKIKKPTEKNAEYIEDFNENMYIINLSSSQQPLLYDFKVGNTPNKDIKIFSGAIVNVKVVLSFNPQYTTLATWPNKVAVKESGGFNDADDAEWKEVNDAPTDDFDENTVEAASDDNFDEAPTPKVMEKAKKRKEKVHVEEESFGF